MNKIDDIPVVRETNFHWAVEVLDFCGKDGVAILTKSKKRRYTGRRLFERQKKKTNKRQKSQLGIALSMNTLQTWFYKYEGKTNWNYSIELIIMWWKLEVGDQVLEYQRRKIIEQVLLPTKKL